MQMERQLLAQVPIQRQLLAQVLGASGTRVADHLNGVSHSPSWYDCDVPCFEHPAWKTQRWSHWGYLTTCDSPLVSKGMEWNSSRGPSAPAIGSAPSAVWTRERDGQQTATGFKVTWGEKTLFKRDKPSVRVQE
jgi:hypothetical protein